MRCPPRGGSETPVPQRQLTHGRQRPAPKTARPCHILHSPVNLRKLDVLMSLAAWLTRSSLSLAGLEHAGLPFVATARRSFDAPPVGPTRRSRLPPHPSRRQQHAAADSNVLEAAAAGGFQSQLQRAESPHPRTPLQSGPGSVPPCA